MNRATIASAVVIAALLGFTAAWLLRGGGSPETSGAAAGDQEREVLYWVAPMDPSYRRDEPGKSPMGMDLVPVYADEESPGASKEPALRIHPAVINNIGVKTAPVERGTLYRRIRTVGFIAPDADRIAHVHVRTEGWIERLAADNEGDPVARGELLFRIYSPALVSAQREYLQALNLDKPALIDASAERLRALGLAPGQVDKLGTSRQVQQLIDVHAPQDGIILELNVREGMFVTPGTTVMSLADLSSVWVDVDVYEDQINWLETGQAARMTLPFSPAREWTGKVDYVYPTIREDSRTGRVRLAFTNPDLALKPHMYATVTIDVAPREDVLHVPAQAVIRTGDSERVILALDGGRFRPAEVVTGLESDGRVEIVEGLAEGERIVVSSQFLIDSEASLDASLLRMLDAGATGAVHDTTGGASTPGQGTHGVDDATPVHESGSTRR